MFVKNQIKSRIITNETHIIIMLYVSSTIYWTLSKTPWTHKHFHFTIYVCALSCVTAGVKKDAALLTSGVFVLTITTHNDSDLAWKTGP